MSQFPEELRGVGGATGSYKGFTVVARRRQKRHRGKP